jgi:ApaG protein
MSSSSPAIYHAVTRGIAVSVTPEFLAGRSQPERDQYFWAYTITISNDSAQSVQLLTRHWVITDADGRVEEVKGPGVIGEQPVLAPGERFTYTSGCPLSTCEGTMAGSYGMIDAAGQPFDVTIPLFMLASPVLRRTLH